MRNSLGYSIPHLAIGVFLYFCVEHPREHPKEQRKAFIYRYLAYIVPLFLYYIVDKDINSTLYIEIE